MGKTKSLGEYQAWFDTVAQLVLRGHCNLSEATLRSVHKRLSSQVYMLAQDGAVPQAVSEISLLVERVVGEVLRHNDTKLLNADGISANSSPVGKQAVVHQIRQPISLTDLAGLEERASMRLNNASFEFAVPRQHLELGLRHLDNIKVPSKWQVDAMGRVLDLAYPWELEKEVTRRYFQGQSEDDIKKFIKSGLASARTKARRNSVDDAVTDVVINIRAMPRIGMAIHLVAMALILMGAAGQTAFALLAAKGSVLALSGSWRQVMVATIRGAVTVAAVASAVWMLAQVMLLVLASGSCSTQMQKNSDRTREQETARASTGQHSAPNSPAATNAGPDSVSIAAEIGSLPKGRIVDEKSLCETILEHNNGEFPPHTSNGPITVAVITKSRAGKTVMRIATGAVQGGCFGGRDVIEEYAFGGQNLGPPYDHSARSKYVCGYLNDVGLQQTVYLVGRLSGGIQYGVYFVASRPIEYGSRDVEIGTVVFVDVATCSRRESMVSWRAIAEKNRDTDSDGLPDWVEHGLGLNEQRPSSDADNLDDSTEIGLVLSSPLESDTDGDGILDDIEWSRGNNPLLRDAYRRDPSMQSSGCPGFLSVVASDFADKKVNRERSEQLFYMRVGPEMRTGNFAPQEFGRCRDIFGNAERLRMKYWGDGIERDNCVSLGFMVLTTGRPDGEREGEMLTLNGCNTEWGEALPVLFSPQGVFKVQKRSTLDDVAAQLGELKSVRKLGYAWEARCPKH